MHLCMCTQVGRRLGDKMRLPLLFHMTYRAFREVVYDATCGARREPRAWVRAPNPSFLSWFRFCLEPKNREQKANVLAFKGFGGEKTHRNSTYLSLHAQSREHHHCHRADCGCALACRASRPRSTIAILEYVILAGSLYFPVQICAHCSVRSVLCPPSCLVPDVHVSTAICGLCVF